MLIRKLVHHLIILNSLKLLIGLVGTCDANVYHSLQIDDRIFLAWLLCKQTKKAI
jgi:hypothetical protein